MGAKRPESFVTGQRQNGWTDRAQILCETLCDPGEGLWKNKIWEKNSCKIVGILFWKCVQFEKKNPLKLKNYLNGRLSEQQLKAKMIYRKGCAKHPKSLVLTVHWYLIEDIPWIGSLIVFKVKLYFFLISNFPHIIVFFSGQSYDFFSA